MGIISMPDAHMEECAPAVHILGGGRNGSGMEDRGNEASHFIVTQYADDTAFSANQSSGSLLLSTLSSSTITMDDNVQQYYWSKGTHSPKCEFCSIEDEYSIHICWR
jgi:hypothetical protein